VTKPCEQVDAFFDGELSAADADAFRAHLATCLDCPAALVALAELEGIASAHRSEVLERLRKEAPSPAPRLAFTPASIARRPRWRRTAPLFAGAVAIAAAAAWLLVGRRALPPPPAPASVALLDSPARSLEGRLSYAPADRYRPYDVQRSVDPAHRERVSLDALARLEKEKDYLGLAAGLLLSGDRDRASEVLDHAGKSTAADVDRAVVELGRGRFEEALDLLAPILEKDPKNGPAQWNMALVLRDMHLDLSAADAFEKVAALGEPGWGAEATAQAKASRDEWNDRVAHWRAAKKAGLAMVANGAVPDPDLVRRYPSYLTRFLYHALRAAPTRDDVLAFLPLATALDGNDGDAKAFRVRAVKRMAAGNFAKRAPLAKEYRAQFPQWIALTFDRPAIESFFARARAAKEDDLAFGAIELTHLIDRDADAMGPIASAEDDPWLSLLAQDARGYRETMREDFARAETTLRGAIAACDAKHLDYLCAKIELHLVEAFILLARTSEGTAVAQSGLRRSRLSAHDQGYRFEWAMADVARQRGASALMAAYTHDALLREPDNCAGKRQGHEFLAVAKLDALDGEGARAEIEQSPLCGEPIPSQRAVVLAALPLFGQTTPELDSLDAEVDHARTAWPPALQSLVDTSLGAALAERDGGAGTARMRSSLASALALPAEDTGAKKARAWARLSLALQAAREGRADEALEQMVDDAGGATESTCALALGVSWLREFAAIRDASGNAAVFYDPRRPSPVIDPARLIPETARARLAGCPTVRVFAPSPIHGHPRLLPDEVAWSYAIGRSSIGNEAAPTAERRLLVSNVEPPAALGLAPLAPWTGGDPGAAATWLHGAAATPANVIAGLEMATEVEIHAHGFVDLAVSDASLLIVSPDDQGRYALTARDIRRLKLHGHPIVVLAACDAARVASFDHEPWSLPLAFIAAGARAVFASPDPIGDAQAAPFFDAVLARVRRGADPAIALRDERVAWLARGASPWIRNVLVFD
jgi:hypothetical protein